MRQDEWINQELRQHQIEQATDWQHREEMCWYQKFFDVVNKRHFTAQPLPQPAFSIQQSRRRVELGHYLQCRNAFALADEISVSARCLEELSLLQRMEIIAHEIVHLWEDLYGTPPKTRWYHSKAFCDRAEELGIIAARGRGHTLKVTDPFVSICRELGINDPIPNYEQPKGERVATAAIVVQKGPRASGGLTKWICECPANVWVGRKSVRIRCEECSAIFERAREKLSLTSNSLMRRD